MFSGLRCPIEHRLVYELCKASIYSRSASRGNFVPIVEFFEGQINNRLFAVIKKPAYLLFFRDEILPSYMGDYGINP